MLFQLCAFVAVVLPMTLAAVVPGRYTISNLAVDQVVIVREDDSGTSLFLGQSDASSEVWEARPVPGGFNLYNVGLKCVAGLGPTPLIFPPLPWPVRCWGADGPSFPSTYTFQAVGQNTFKIEERAYGGYVWQAGSPYAEVFERSPAGSDEENWVFRLLDE